jgi:hypothetical protein
MMTQYNLKVDCLMTANTARGIHLRLPGVLEDPGGLLGVQVRQSLCAYVEGEHHLRSGLGKEVVNFYSGRL